MKNRSTRTFRSYGYEACQYKYLNITVAVRKQTINHSTTKPLSSWNFTIPRPSVKRSACCSPVGMYCRDNSPFAAQTRNACQRTPMCLVLLRLPEPLLNLIANLFVLKNCGAPPAPETIDEGKFLQDATPPYRLLQPLRTPLQYWTTQLVVYLLKTPLTPQKYDFLQPKPISESRILTSPTAATKLL